MNLSLRAKLRLPTDCSDAELQAACSRYHAIYKGVLNSSADESVKDIARAKLNDLLADARAEKVGVYELGDVVFSSQSANINADVEAELAGMSTSLTTAQANRLNAMIDKLPESAKRYYLSALVLLYSGESSTETYAEAVSKLKAAAINDPENPIYQAMIEDIGQEINRYRGELAIWQEARDREIARQNRRELVKEIFSTIGSVLLWICGAALTIGGVLFSCFCSMCDAC